MNEAQVTEIEIRKILNSKKYWAVFCKNNWSNCDLIIKIMEDGEELETPGAATSFYGTCSLDVQQRQLISRLYQAWKELGWKPSQFEALLETAGFPVPRSTLNRWSRTSGEPVASLSLEKKRGRPSLLDEAGAELVVGYCLSKILNGESVHLQTVVNFCRESLGVEITASTASNILHETGFSLRVAQVSSSGICVDIKKLAEVCSDWIKEQREAGLFSADPLLLGSIDFTFTKHTKTRTSTFSIRGG